MILFEIPDPPHLFVVVTVLFVNTAIFFIISYLLFYGVNQAKNKNITITKKAYSLLVAIFFGALFILPIRQAIIYKRHFNIWDNYQSGKYISFNGIFDSIKIDTVSARIVLNKSKYFYADIEPSYCFSFSKKKTGFDKKKAIYIRYVPLGKSADTSYCIVYAEQQDGDGNAN
jgi:hypothetical protein